MNIRLQNVIMGILVVAGIVLCALLFAAEGHEKKNGSTTKKATEPIPSTAAIVNAPTKTSDIQTCLAVVTSVNNEAETISFRSFEEEEDFFFRLEEMPYFYTAYDNSMTLAQVDMGDVGYITYDAASNTLCEFRLAKDVVCYHGLTGISVNTSYRTISIHNRKYEYSRNLVVASGSQLIEPEQLSENDIVNVYEYDGKIVSIVVTRGHGYLSLTGVDLFIGGYVSVGNEVVKTIDKNMMITVTEGEYKVSVSHNGYYGYKTVYIEPDKVAVVDFSEYTADTIECGNVFFDINVDGALLYLNGEETDYSEGILTLPVGSYSVRVSADGYENYVDKIEIKADYQKVNIRMTPEETTAAPTTTSGTSSTKKPSSTAPTTKETESESRTTKSTDEDTEETETETTKVSKINRVYVDGPVGATIYFDGIYIGIAPLDFEMVTGQHVFIVVDGTDVASYTVYLVEGADDVRFDFSKKQN